MNREALTGIEEAFRRNGRYAKGQRPQSMRDADKRYRERHKTACYAAVKKCKKKKGAEYLYNKKLKMHNDPQYCAKVRKREHDYYEKNRKKIIERVMARRKKGRQGNEDD